MVLELDERTGNLFEIYEIAGIFEITGNRESVDLPTFTPTTVLLTPPGRGAVATLLFDGPVALIDAAGLFRAANGKPLAEQAVDVVVFGRWGAEPGEEVVLCRTSETTLEIHCHGGQAARQAIAGDLERLGAPPCDPWEYIERTDGVFARMAARGLAMAPTPRTAASITHQTHGPLRDELIRMADKTTSTEEMSAIIERLLAWETFGVHLIEPWQVVLFGRPNVGKSSLMNRLAGFERAIVLDVPGTTRDLVTTEIALDGWPIRLTDTAGLRDRADELELSGIERARSRIASADLRILVLDRAAPPQDEELELLRTSTAPLVVANKVDQRDAWGTALPPEAIPLSARTGEGVDELMTRILERLVPLVPSAETPVAFDREQIATLHAARRALAQGDEESARQRVRAIAPKNPSA